MSQLLEDVDSVYSSLAGGAIRRHWITDSAFAEVSTRLAQLIRDLGDVGDDEVTRRALSWPKRFRYTMSCTPLEYSHALTHCVAPPVNTIDLVDSFALAYRGFGDRLRDVIAGMQHLADGNQNPFLENVRSLIRRGAVTALLIRDRRHVPCVAAACAGITDELTVLTSSQLTMLRPFESLIVAGAVRWYPPFVLTSPRAPQIEVVCHAWIHDATHAQASLAEDSVKVGRLTPKITDSQRPPTFVSDASLDDVVPQVDVDALVRRAHAETPGERLHERARFVQLEEDWGVFLPADDESTVFVIEFDGDEPHVGQTPANEIREGMFVVLRTKGSGDYLRSVADSLLGQLAAPGRTAQTLWKEALRDKVDVRGAGSVVQSLRKDFGLERLTLGKIQYWSSERNIAPGDKGDFQRVLMFLGIANLLESTWQHVVRIRSAHQQAGGVIRDKLIDVVRDANRSEFDVGIMEFTLPVQGAGKLTAFRVVRVAEGVFEVPGSQIGRPIEAES